MAEDQNSHATTNGVTIGVVKESVPGETRVGLIPDSVKHLIGKGTNVIVQAGAGEGSSISDSEFEEAGARIVGSLADVHDTADVVVRVQSPSPDRGELDGLKRDQILVSFLAPLVNHDMNRQLADTGVTAMAVDAVPRITRAQSMDALSAMSTIAGYKAVLLAAETLPKFFPLLMTAAGTIRPARVLVLGAGVAGLQAIATARRLGAVVESYDARPVVKEQVESLGAKFVEIDTGASDAEAAGGYAREATPEELRKQQEGLNDHIAKADVVVTTALVPGRPAPLLIPAVAVERMHHGSVIVDLAAETGGNCELTTPGEVTTEHGVTIIGTLNLPATLPVHASQMYAKVITNFLDLLIKDGQVNLNFDDEIIANMAVTNRGDIVQAQTREIMGLDDQPAESTESMAEAEHTSEPSAEDDHVEATAVTDSAEQTEDGDRYPVLAETDSSDDESDAIIESSEAGHAVVDDEDAHHPGSAEAGPSDTGDVSVSDDGSHEVDLAAAASAGGFADVEDEGLDFGSDAAAGDVHQHADTDVASESSDARIAEQSESTDSKDSADATARQGHQHDVSEDTVADVELEDIYSTAEFVGDDQSDADGGETPPAAVNQHADADAFPGKSAFAAPAATFVPEDDSAEDDDDEAVYGSHEPDLGASSEASPAKSSKLPKSGEGTDWVAGDGTASMPEGFPVKGNANSGLYHPHESPSYENTIAEICFASSEAAEKHGYRLPKGLEKAAREAATQAEEESN